MARSSDTRDKVRAAAAAMLTAGEVISSRGILKKLGAGSLTTITDELSKWEAERTATTASAGTPLVADVGVLAPSPERTALPGLSPAADLLAPFDEVFSKMQAMADLLSKMSTELSEVKDELSEVRKANEEQLKIAYQRYEAVQRHALLQIDDSRQATADLRQKLSLAVRDAETREDAQRGKAQALREENVRLLGRLEVFEELYGKRAASS